MIKLNIWMFKEIKLPYLFMVMLNIINGICILISVTIPGLLTISLNKNKEELIILLILFLICVFLNFVLPPIILYYLNYKILPFIEIKNQEIYKLVCTFSLELLEDKSIQDIIFQTEKFTDSFLVIFPKILTLTKNLTYIFLIIIISLYIDPLVTLILIFSSLFNVLLKFFELRKSNNIWQRYENLSRDQKILHSILIDKEHNEERKIFDTFYILNKKFTDKYKEFSKNIKDIGLKRLIFEFGYSIFIVLLQIMIFIYLINLLYIQKINIGQFLILLSFSNSIINSIINDSLSIYSDSQNFIQNFKSYLFLKNKVSKQNFLKEKDLSSFLKSLQISPTKIEFKNVYFKYKLSNDHVIQNFSYTFMTNKNYVIVGPNGSGKSTLSKLLVGLYTPSSGQVLLNDLEVYKLDDSIKSQVFSYLLQSPNKYPISIKENVVFKEDYTDDFVINKLEKIDESITKSILRFKQGINSSLSETEESLLSLSGGQMQKLFFTRIDIKPSNVMIFDEPTSSLDPIAELLFYESIKNMINKKINIFISHRMGIVKYADEILVVDNGKLIESGSFNSLMSLKGKFYEMYNAQKKLYE